MLFAVLCYCTLPFVSSFRHSATVFPFFFFIWYKQAWNNKHDCLLLHANLCRSVANWNCKITLIFGLPAQKAFWQEKFVWKQIKRLLWKIIASALFFIELSAPRTSQINTDPTRETVYADFPCGFSDGNVLRMGDFYEKEKNTKGIEQKQKNSQIF